MSRFVRIACESFRCPSFSYISHPGRRACRTRHTEHHHARPRLCRQYRSAGQNGPRWLARQQRGLPGRHPRRASRTTHPAGSTNTSPAPSPSLWRSSKPARLTSCQTSPTPKNAPKNCSSHRTPRAPSATTSMPGPSATIWPRVTPERSKALPSAATPALCKPSLASNGSPTKESPAHTRSMTETPFSLMRWQTARSMPSS